MRAKRQRGRGGSRRHTRRQRGCGRVGDFFRQTGKKVASELQKLVTSRPAIQATTVTYADNERPVTKRDFKELQASIVWPPTFTCNQDLRSAEEMVQRQDEILLDNALTSSEKLR